MSRLLEARRLVLVLDLDHTLVNSVKFSEVDAEWEYRLEQTVAEQVRAVKDRLFEAVNDPLKR
jgi:RNA polymerase II C-terminal domain phosphatase-like 3/4